MTEEHMQDPNEAAEESVDQPMDDAVLEPADQTAETSTEMSADSLSSEEAGASTDPVSDDTPSDDLDAEEETEPVEEIEPVEMEAVEEAESEPMDEEEVEEEEKPEPVMRIPVEVEPEEIPEEPEEELNDDGRAWYVIHCYSGQENKVRHNLEQRIESMDMKDYIFDVVVPTEEEIEVKEGKRRTVERRVFPGYVLVNLLLSEESWYVVRNTPGVTGFVGMGNDPTPLRPDEVSSIIKRMEADAPRIKVTFRPSERVRIVDGPFNDFHGVVDEIDMDRAKVRVMVNFFGRETPVELDFLQVEKA
jgi:transcriptional antiterminator NusG